jgi:hypothetical protein
MLLTNQICNKNNTTIIKLQCCLSHKVKSAIAQECIVHEHFENFSPT